MNALLLTHKALSQNEYAQPKLIEGAISADERARVRYDELIQDLLNDPTMQSHELWGYFRDGLQRLGRLPLEYRQGD